MKPLDDMNAARRLEIEHAIDAMKTTAENLLKVAASLSGLIPDKVGSETAEAIVKEASFDLVKEQNKLFGRLS
ncbi:MAG: hypothetical protein A4E48_00074 [Methanosaeta sp. PtaU1.Bin060]|nr:MAG: hypothetical protein A4E45_02080 [Methanosaeta sp. PtaB.Bin039]OPY55385.1 MAG: hypothetical protein A4E48_00074 [Methanosaeta sp. PtaU1.Bin060]